MNEKDLIVLSDGTEREIEDNSSLDNITIIFDTREELDSFFAKLSMEENTKYVEFKKKNSNATYAKYDNLVLISKDKTITEIATTEIVKKETVVADNTETEVLDDVQTTNNESTVEDTVSTTDGESTDTTPVVENETITEVVDSATEKEAMETITTYTYKLLFGLRKKTDLEIRMDHAEDAIKLLTANALM